MRPVESMDNFDCNDLTNCDNIKFIIPILLIQQESKWVHVHLNTIEAKNAINTKEEVLWVKEGGFRKILYNFNI